MTNNPTTTPSPHSHPLRMALAVNGAAILATIALFRVLAPIFPPSPGVATDVERLTHALHLLVGPAAVLLLMVLATALCRALSGALDPLNDPESRAYRKNQRALANTVEQTAIFGPALLALATLLPAADTGVETLCADLFVAGRLLFWLGYLIHPLARAPGMAMTLTVNVFVVGLDLWLLPHTLA